jgi:hypothetical protein
MYRPPAPRGAGGASGGNVEGIRNPRYIPTAAENQAAGTGRWPRPFIAGALRRRTSQASRKRFLIRGYAYGWISAADVALWFDTYQLQAA